MRREDFGTESVSVYDDVAREAAHDRSCDGPIEDPDRPTSVDLQANCSACRDRGCRQCR